MQCTPIPGEPAASHTLEESNISSTKSKGKYDPMTSNSILSLPRSINGELDAFQVTNRDNKYDNDGIYQENGEYWKPHRIIGHD